MRFGYMNFARTLCVVACFGSSACGGDDPDPATNNSTSNNATNNSSMDTTGTTVTTNNTTNNTTTDTTNTTTPPVAQEASEFLQGYVDIFEGWSCTVAFTCPEREPGLLLASGRFPDQQTCFDESRRTSFVFAIRPALVRGVAEGRITFDAAKGEACLNGLRARVEGNECMVDALESFFDVEESELDSDCAETFIGQVALGDACLEDVDCAGDSVCGPSASADSCYGACITSTAGGEGKMPGEDCSFGDECVEGYGCLIPSGMISGTCAEAESVMDGGECGDGFGSEVLCVEGSFCDEGTCAPIPALTELMDGAPCMFGDQFNFCSAGLVCTNITLGPEGPAGQCGTPVAEGGACRLDFECAGGLVCIGGSFGAATGTCSERAAVGGACAVDNDCADFICGSDDVCVDPAACMLP